MSNSVRPHRWQPTTLPCPWDSPGRNTEVGCHFLLQCIKVKSESEVAQLCPTPSNPMDFSLPGPSVHGIFQARVLEWGASAFSGQHPNNHNKKGDQFPRNMKGSLGLSPLDCLRDREEILSPDVSCITCSVPGLRSLSLEERG